MSAATTTKLRQIVVEAIFRRKRLFLFLVLSIMAAVLAFTFLIPRQYKSEAKLIVQNVREAAPLSATAPVHQTTRNEVSESEINSEADLLQSPMIAHMAVGAPTGGVQTHHAQQEINRLSHHLKVDPVHQTSLINLSYTAQTPDQANRELQRVIDSYFEARAGHSMGTGAADFFNGQLEKAKRQLDADQQALTDYGLKHDISELDDEKKLQLARVSSLQDQIAQIDSQLAMQRTRRAQQAEQLQNTPARSRGLERSITNQYSQERLNTSLVDLENRRAELVRRYAPSDRQILELDDKIANTKLAISDAASKPAAETATEVNPVYQQLSSAVAMSEGEVSGSQAQRAVLQHQFDQAQNRLDELERATTDVNALKRNLDQARTDYALYAQRKADAHISAELDKMKIFDVSLVQPPYSTGEPVRPRPLLYAVTGLVFAFLFATLVVVYLDTSSGYFYTPGQLDNLTGTRTLATLADAHTAPHAEEINALEYRRLLYGIHKAMQQRRLDPHGSSILPMVDTPHGEWPRGVIAQEAYVIAVTSSVRGEGVSYITEHLAHEAARQFGSQVAVVDMREMLRRFEADGNLRFGFALQEPGNYWVLANENDRNSSWREIGSRGNFAARLCPWIDRAREEMDLILLDCPSNVESTLGSEVEPCVDGYVAVVSAGYTRKASVDQLTATLSDRRVPVLGYLLNRRTYPVPRWLHRLI
ncbi:exopolysaccharide transport family protein [Terriglobus sp.]|uniref:exopolysaccharide transport family protein n=1 Tax=Terriglobus sp. TaxID=1889013 RepID=UPI003AFFF304